MHCRQSAIDLAKELIKFDTINPPGNEDACARHVGTLLHNAGFVVEYHQLSAGRSSVIAYRGLNGSTNGGLHRKPICFTGHLDTVPLGAAPWTVDPLSGEIIDGKLYGRGSSDMKGGVAAMVIAALQCIDIIDVGPGLVFVLTAGEETGCDGARHLASHGNALREAGAIVVGEPTRNHPCVGHKGVLWMNATTRGVTSHGSMPEQGVNAVYLGARLVNKLEDFGFNTQPHQGLGSPTLNVGRMAGGININSVPDRAEISIDIRTVPGLDHCHITESLNSYLAPELAELTTMLDLAPVWTEPRTPWVQRVYELAERYVGRSSKFEGAPFFTDASVLKPAYGDVPTVILGPGETQMAHRTDEYCWVTKIEEAVELYRDIVIDWQTNSRYEQEP